MIKLLLISIFIVPLLSKYPVAIFHGMGDSCSFPGMQSFTSYISSKVQAYAECIEIGDGSIDSIAMKFTTQGEQACASLQSNSKFKGSISVLGLSQGALIARYIVENCSFDGNVKRYISIGGPQMGVGVLPKCSGSILSFICQPFNWVTRELVYSDVVQNNVGPAGYFRNPYDYKSYLSGATFLPTLNNEKEGNMTARKENFTSLEKAVFVKFDQDTMIIPRETAWFGFYDVDGTTIINIEDSEFYKSDYIGMKKLNEEKKIEFLTFQGDHLQFSYDQIEKNIIPALI